MKRIIVASLLALASITAHAAPPKDEAGVTRIVLDEYNGYFSAKETLAGLQAGKYEFVVTNKTDKMVGFQLQDAGDESQLAIFPLQPGETHSEIVEVDSDGFRYRCPINPTPWYEVKFAK